MGKKLYSYFYFRGKTDESQHVRLTHREVIDLYSLFYHFGILSEKFKNSPKRLMFIDELYQNFSRCNKLPTTIVVNLDDTLSDTQDYTIYIKNKYSHRLMRQILSALGYQISIINFTKIVKRKNILKKEVFTVWSSFVAHR